MNTNNSETNAMTLRKFAITLIAGSMIMPAVGLLGWLTNALLLASFGEKYIPMAPSTAICFILLSSSLLIMFRPSLGKFRVIVIGMVASIVTLYGLLTFVGLSMGLPILPDNLLFPVMGTLDSIPMGRMASSNGILFVFSGISLLFTLVAFNRVKQSGLLKLWAGLSGSIVLFVGFLFLIGYVISSPLFYGGSTIPMALTSSITFTLLGAGLLMMLNSKNNIFDHPLTMLKNTKIGTQLKIGFTTLLLFVIILGSISYQQSSEINMQTEYMYNHPLKVRITIGQLTASVYSIRIDMKNMVLGSLLGEVNKNEAEKIDMEFLDENFLNEIKILQNSYLGPVKDIDSLRHEFIKWKLIRDETVRLLRAGKILEAAEKSSIIGVGVQQAETVIRSLEKISHFAIGKGNDLYATSQKLQYSLNMQLLFLTAFIVLISLMISRLILGAVRKPIDELINATQRFQKGDFTARSSYTLQNEFGELSNSYNTLADGIHTNLSLNKKIENISGLMIGEEDAKIFFQKTLHSLSVHTDSQIAAVYFLSNDQKSFDLFESIGLDNNARQSFAADNFEGEFGSALSARKVQHIKNIPEDTRFVFHTVSGEFFPREILTIPVHANYEVIAIISLASVSAYSQPSILFIDRILVTLCARVEGIMAYQKMKELSEKLEHQNSELEAQKTELSTQSAELHEQNTELEMQKNEMGKANRLKTDFLSNMSHELRTPLNSVIALSGILNRRLAKAIPEEEYSYLEIIERNGNHLLSLINDILDISRIEAGYEEIEITKFNANNLIADVASMIHPQTQENKIELLHNDSEAIITISSDVDKCRHILQNLIGNAVKFTENGKVEILAHQKGSNINIIVTDTGIGISKDNLLNIFDEFRQSDGSTSRKFGGTGLGLAIAKKYANLLGGTIAVKSVLGKGSEFTITLPLIYASGIRNIEVKSAADLNRSIKQTLHKPVSNQLVKTILLVEDSEPAIIQIKDILDEGGYNILVARNGSEALAIIEQTIPDAMILDLMMPGIDGFQVLRIIREAELTSAVPVLILTAKHITKEELKFLTRNNIHQLIQKGNIKRNELLNSVASMVSTETVEIEKPKQKIKASEDKPVFLVVEDNPDNMTTVKALLGNDYDVIEAVDGKEAVEMVLKHNIHLILMDIALPVMDGIDAFRLISKLPKLQNVPIIAITASAMTKDRERLLALGFDAFIPKPIDEQVFYKTVNETLYGK